MSSVRGLRAFVTERLTAAAEEILGAFAKTIADYEEEIDRQRRLLDVVRRPEVKLHRIERHVCNEKLLANQQLCGQRKRSILHHTDPEPSEVKEEQEDLCTSQEGEQLVLKQATETQALMLIPPYEGSDHGEPEPISSSPVINNVDESPTSESHSKTPRDKDVLKCEMCGKSFKSNSIFQRHLRRHTGEKAHACSACGKGFSVLSSLKVHLRLHTCEQRTLKCLKTHPDQKPLSCHICGKRFTYLSHLKIHFRIHGKEKPYSCPTCKRAFMSSFGLEEHIRRTHTDQQPHICNTCGKRFLRNVELVRHFRVHTGERPYACHICGKTFKQPGSLSNHLKTRIHVKDAEQPS